MLADLTITQFLEKTASDEPVPAGGCMAAFNAAASAGLTAMVAKVTLGKKGYADVADLMKKIAPKADACRSKLIRDIDRDAEAYRQVIAAFRLPKNTEDEKQIRANAIQDAFRYACLVPLSVAEDAFEMMKLAEIVTEKGNKNAHTDGLAAIIMAKSAVLIALHNVRANLESVTDKTFSEDMRKKMEGLKIKD